MSDDRASADGVSFQKHVRNAAWRFRLERLSRMSLRVAWGLAIALSVLLIIALLISPGIWAIPIAVGLCGVAVGEAALFLGMKVERQRLLSRMDIQARLPDSILSAGDWENVEPNDPWRARQREVTLTSLSKIDWKKTWPVHWPRLLWVPLASSVFLMAVIAKVQMDWVYQQQKILAALNQENAPVAADQVKPVEQVFKDWDEAQKIAPSPEILYRSHTAPLVPVGLNNVLN